MTLGDCIYWGYGNGDNEDKKFVNISLPVEHTSEWGWQVGGGWGRKESAQKVDPGEKILRPLLTGPEPATF